LILLFRNILYMTRVKAKHRRINDNSDGCSSGKADRYILCVIVDNWENRRWWWYVNEFLLPLSLKIAFSPRQNGKTERSSLWMSSWTRSTTRRQDFTSHDKTVIWLKLSLTQSPSKKCNIAAMIAVLTWKWNRPPIILVEWSIEFELKLWLVYQVIEDQNEYKLIFSLW